MSIDWSGQADSLEVFEDRTVSLTSVRMAGNVISEDVPADRGKVSWRVMQAMAAAYVRPEVMYTVRKSQAAGPWKPGDLLLDSTQEDAEEEDYEGITYTIQYAEADEASWILAGFNPKVAFDLRHTVDIYLNDVTLDSAKSIVVSSAGLAYADIPARVQPTANTFQEYEGRQGALAEYSIYLYSYPVSPVLTHNHIIVWRDPETNTVKTFDVKSWDSAQQIDRLTQIHGELRP